MTTYHYTLNTFEGPLDLLLHLIERHKINIYDIPIANITEQYMSYLENWNQFDIRYSSEFLVMAATLLQIKSRLLLPKRQEDDVKEEDPRDELVQKLLEFQQIKQLATEIEALQEVHSGSYSRLTKYSQVGTKATFNLQEVSWLTLFYEALHRLPKEVKEVPEVVVEKESVSVESSRELLLDRVWLGKVAFADWIGEAKTREVLVNRFLAVLECLKLQVLQLEDETELILVPGSNFQTIEGGIHA